MKHVVVSTDLESFDIRPPALLARFRDVSVAESVRLFREDGAVVEVACPACDSDESDFAFEKHGFSFRECRRCASVFASPRPTAERLRMYYEQSRAASFRVDYFVEGSGESRLGNVLRSRVNWIERALGSQPVTKRRAYADIGTIYPDLVRLVGGLEEFEQVYSVAPPAQVISRIREHCIVVNEEPATAVDLVTAFEQLEHQYSPFEFLRSIHHMLIEGGLLLLTTRTVSGFDLQILWDRAPYIFVPEHLNLLSIDGLVRLMNRAGYEILELSTPGQLDVDLIAQAMADKPDIEVPRFVRNCIVGGGDRVRRDFQFFLQQHRMSSHVRILAACRP